MPTTPWFSRPSRTAILLLPAAAAALAAAGGVRSVAVEAPGPLRSDRYLSADLLSGPDWKVAPEAETDGFGVTYSVTSRFGTWPAFGRTQVGMRISEIKALAQLEEVSKTEVFVAAVKSSATAPLRLVSSFAEKPKETLKAIPSGVGRWFKKTSFQVKEGYHDAKQAVSGDDKEGGGGQGDKDLKDKSKEEATKYALSYLKISGAERNWYAKLQVDPYTDNQLLREAVTSVARVEGLTSFAMKFVGLPGIPGAREIRKTMEIVWATDPWELRMNNRKKLLAMGLSEETARAFEDNPWISLSLQTAFVQALEGLAGVGGRELLVARAIDVESRQEGSTLVSSVLLLERYHRQQGAIAEFLGGARLPVARTAKGELVALALADALFWTGPVAEAAGEFAALYGADPAKARFFYVVGEASPAFKAGARELGWEVRGRWQLAAPEDEAPAAAR